MEVKHQNAFPSLGFDLLAAAQKFSWLMPVGWYYKTFTRRRAWAAAEPWMTNQPRSAPLGEPRPVRGNDHSNGPHPDVAESQRRFLNVFVNVILQQNGSGFADIAAKSTRTPPR